MNVWITSRKGGVRSTKRRKNLVGLRRKNLKGSQGLHLLIPPWVGHNPKTHRRGTLGVWGKEKGYLKTPADKGG